jgi:hypothetical protein
MAIGQDQAYSVWLAANRTRLSQFEERIKNGQQLTNQEYKTIEWLKQLDRTDYLKQGAHAKTLTQEEQTELESIIARERAESNAAFDRQLERGYRDEDYYGGYRKRKLMKSKKYKKSKKSKKSKRYKKITRRRQRQISNN